MKYLSHSKLPSLAINIDKILKVHDYLDSLPEIGKVLSVASGIKLARLINDGEDLNDLELALLRSVLPEDIRETLLYSYINKDDSIVRISTRVNESAENLNRNELLEKINNDFFMVFIAEQRLKDAGYGEKSLLAPQDDDDEETSMKLVIRIFDQTEFFTIIIQRINFCNKIPLYFQDVEVQVAPWNTTKAYMLAMKVSLTKNI